MSTAVRWVAAWLGRLALAMLVLAAVYVMLGRLLMPMAAGHRADIEASLGSLLGTEVSIGALNGRWWRFSPLLSLRDLEIRFAAAGGGGTHVIESLDLQLDVARSLWRRQWVVGKIALDDLRLELAQEAGGRWRLAGVDVGAGNDLQVLADFLLNTASLRVNQASLLLRPRQGPAVALHNGYLRLDNRAGRHRLQLQVNLREQAMPVRLYLELDGDPRGEFTGRSYLSLPDADLSRVLALAGSSRLAGLQALQGEAGLWADFDQSGLRELHGRLDGLNLRADTGAVRMNLGAGHATFSARRQGMAHWQLWLQDLGFDWRGQRWQPGEIFLELDRDAEPATFNLLAERMDLGIARDMLLESGLLPARGRRVLADLAPTGSLSQVNLRGDMSGSSANDFLLRANLRDVAVQAWSGAPAASGIDGYIQAGRDSGFVELDAEDFSLHLPRLFPGPWHYQQASSRVHWALADGRIRVHSNVIDARNEDLHGRVQFDLRSRRRAAGDWTSELTLMIGALEMDAAAKSSYLPRLEGLADTMSWLDRALVGGHIRDSGLVFRGALGRDVARGSSTTRAFYHFEEARLDYLPDWPPVEDGAGFVRLRDQQVEVLTRAASVAGIPLEPAHARLAPAPDGAGSWLAIEGAARLDAGRGLAFLRDSPVRREIGGFLDDWQAQGALDVELALGIPMGRAGTPRVDVDVMSAGSRLRIPEHGLDFDAVQGRLNYSSAAGLRAEALTARLFGYPLSASIDRFGDPGAGAASGQSGIRIRASGRASRQALQDWPRQNDFVASLLDFASGEIDYQADLRLYPAGAGGAPRSSLRLNSDLRGLAVDLPAPFDKTARDSAPLELQLDFGPGGQALTGRYGGQAYARLDLADGAVTRGLVNFGPQSRGFNVRQSDNNAPGLLVTGRLDSFDLEAWRRVAAALGGGAGGAGASPLRLADVDIGRLRLGGYELEDINTQVRRDPDAWRMILQSDLLSGRFVFPDAAGAPLDIRLDYLRLPRSEQAAEGEPPRQDPLQGIDPASLPALAFSTEEFRVGDKRLGRWQFHLDPLPEGARLSDFRMEMADASISGITAQSGAQLDWRHDGAGHDTAFTGRFRAGDLARVLPALGYDANVESESADFSGSLAWAGSPAAFSITGASGSIDLAIQDGRFVDLDSGTSRLLGAFNFDSIVRRLQLDFSDLYERGFAYDTIDGSLTFQHGIITTRPRVRIQGPSSKIAIEGQIDLPRETIQADMLVNVPLSQNISVLAGILGAWPLAVSTYVAGRIFEEQMDDFTSVVYRLEGPWENLDAGFEAPAGVARPASPSDGGPAPDPQP